MSVVGACVLLGVLVLVLIATRQASFAAAVVCVVFGLVLSSTSAGPAVNRSLTEFGGWVWERVSAL